MPLVLPVVRLGCGFQFTNGSANEKREYVFGFIQRRGDFTSMVLSFGCGSENEKT